MTKAHLWWYSISLSISRARQSISYKQRPIIIPLNDISSQFSEPQKWSLFGRDFLFSMTIYRFQSPGSCDKAAYVFRNYQTFLALPTGINKNCPLIRILDYLAFPLPGTDLRNLDPSLVTCKMSGTDFLRSSFFVLIWMYIVFAGKIFWLFI